MLTARPPNISAYVSLAKFMTHGHLQSQGQLENKVLNSSIYNGNQQRKVGLKLSQGPTSREMVSCRNTNMDPECKIFKEETMFLSLHMGKKSTLFELEISANQILCCWAF